MAEVKEYPTKKKKYLLSRDNEEWDFGKISLRFHERKGWMVKYGFFDMLSSDELRLIANKLDKLNAKKQTQASAKKRKSANRN